jgi:hypothetical protein
MGTIAKLSRQAAARVESLPGFEGRYVEGDEVFEKGDAY